MSIDQKADLILAEIGKLNVTTAEMKKDMESSKRDIQELRSDLWGSGSIKKKVEKHDTALKIITWLGATLGGAAILALYNSIFHLIVKQ